MEILLGLKEAVIHRLGDEAQARQEAFERLCERSGVPQVLRKFPLQTKIELRDEADLQRDLAERQLEAQLSRRYSRLIDRLYQRQVLGREVVDEEEMDEDLLLLQPVPEVPPVAAAAQGAVIPPGEAPEQLDVLDVPDVEAEPQSWPVVPPVKDHWLSGALHTFLAEKESQAKKMEEEADEVEEAEEVEVEAKVKRKREDENEDDEEETAPPQKKRSRNTKAKSDTNKSPRSTKRTQKEDDAASCSFRAEITGTTTLLFYRPRPYYCAARDTEGFVWTGRSLLDEWDSTDDSPGSGFNRLWSLTRPKRLDLTKFVQACQRVRNRPQSATTKGALFLARNVRLVRECAATARLPTFPALAPARPDVESTDSLGDVDEEGASQAYDDDEEKASEEPKRRKRTRKRATSADENFVPKHRAPPSPPMGSRRRGVVRRKNGRTSRRTPPRARVTRRAAAASASASPATPTESGSKSVARATAKPSMPTAVTSSSSSSSSSSTRSRDTSSSDRRRITPTIVPALPNGPKTQPSSGRPLSETSAAVTPQPPPSLSRRTERVVEISFPLTPRTPTLRAGQNGGSTRLRVVSHDRDDESLSDSDDPFAFPDF